MWDIKDLPSYPSPPLTPTVTPQTKETDLGHQDDFSILEKLLEQNERLKKELKNKMSGGVDRLPSEDLESVSSSSDVCLGGLRSGIGSRLRRKVNWYHDQNVEKIEKEEKRLKLASPSPVSISSEGDINVEEKETEIEHNRSPVVDKNDTASAISTEDEDEDEENLYGADPDELEALSRMTEKY